MSDLRDFIKSCRVRQIELVKFLQTGAKFFDEQVVDMERLTAFWGTSRDAPTGL